MIDQDEASNLGFLAADEDADDDDAMMMKEGTFNNDFYYKYSVK